MKNLLITAALVGGIAAPAYADQWVDTNTGMALGDLPDGSGPIDLLDASKSVCRIKTGQVAGVPGTPRFMACMKREGYVFISGDTPNQARNRAIADAQMRAMGQAVGQALIDLGNNMNAPPVHCHPHTLQLGC